MAGGMVRVDTAEVYDRLWDEHQDDPPPDGLQVCCLYLGTTCLPLSSHHLYLGTNTVSWIKIIGMPPHVGHDNDDCCTERVPTMAGGLIGGKMAKVWLQT